jgi:hypothetical protein
MREKHLEEIREAADKRRRFLEKEKEVGFHSYTLGRFN